MGELDNRYMDSVTASDDQSADETVSENPLVIHAATNSQSINIAFKRSKLGFLSLPPELRLMVYRQLFHDNDGIIDMAEWQTSSSSLPPLLQTCKLINKEAFEALLENPKFIYRDPDWPRRHPPQWPISKHIRMRVVDTIQSLDVRIVMEKPTTKFLHLIREFGNPARIRRFLKVTFSAARVDSFLYDRPITWFLTGLCTFTNFETVDLSFQFAYTYNDIPFNEFPSDSIAQTLQHRFGSAKFLIHSIGPQNLYWDGYILQFHPHNHRHSQQAQRAQRSVDWMDLLDGTRLEWNQNETANANHDADQNANERADRPLEAPGAQRSVFDV